MRQSTIPPGPLAARQGVVDRAATPCSVLTRPVPILGLALAATLGLAQEGRAQAGGWGGVAGVAATRGYMAAPGGPEGGTSAPPTPVDDAKALLPPEDGLASAGAAGPRSRRTEPRHRPRRA